MTDCTICGTALTSEPDPVAHVKDCPRCGRWQFLAPKKTQRSYQEALSGYANQELARTNLSHKVRRMGREGMHVGVPIDDLPAWGLNDPLPRPMQQVDDLILYVGQQLPTAAHQVPVDDLLMCAWLGTTISERDPAVGLKWLLNQDQLKRWVIAQPSGGRHVYRLTWAGWERYEDLMREEVTSRVAFMAMQFGDPATATKIVRYYAAAAWFSADVYIRTNGITKPSPQEFMQVWRKAIFTQIALLFDDLSPKGEQLLWTMMFDDIDAYGRIMAEQMRVNAPYLPMIVGKHWFAETQQMDILKGYNSEKSGMLVLAAAVDCQTRVTATLKEHCR